MMWDSAFCSMQILCSCGRDRLMTTLQAYKRGTATAAHSRLVDRIDELLRHMLMTRAHPLRRPAIIVRPRLGAGRQRSSTSQLWPSGGGRSPICVPSKA